MALGCRATKHICVRQGLVVKHIFAYTSAHHACKPNNNDKEKSIAPPITELAGRRQCDYCAQALLSL